VGFLALLSAQADTVRLDELKLAAVATSWGTPHTNQSASGKPMSIGGVKYAHGVGVQVASECPVALDGLATTFTAKVGVDDDERSKAAAVEFFVHGDDRELWRSGVCKPGEAARECRVELTGIKSLELAIVSAGENFNRDLADWADATFEFAGAAPRVESPPVPQEEAVILTPVAPAAPRIQGPKIYGVRPGSPFLYRIPATGERPMHFAAKGLPAGLSLDGQSGIITGRVAKAGRYPTTLSAKNAHGSAKREFRIVVGGTLALTPPMGWNSWYIHYHRVSDVIMRAAADQMIASGMADYGYQYVNIDDCWMKKRKDEPYRDADGAVLANARFPDMKGLADYIHSRGLKAGLYTSPGPWTCGGYVGAFQHEGTDARKFAAWGFDFLKYDWCSYRPGPGGDYVEELKKPYQKMWEELQKLDRDVVFNLCQYGRGDVWKWGGDVGNSWRTTGDLGLRKGARLPGFYDVAINNARHWQYARPGAWNDPDYILIGWVGNAEHLGQGTPTSLTPSEQYSYMSLWSLMAAPLIFSGDMGKLDAFTLNLLCNAEVIAVDQDVLGKQARIIRRTRNEFVLLKDLEDGSKALGIFNLASRSRKLSVAWAELGLAGKQQVRDLWRQIELGTYNDAFEAEVPRHGVALVRLSVR
jgi:alpha-galactosidase